MPGLTARPFMVLFPNFCKSLSPWAGRLLRFTEPPCLQDHEGVTHNLLLCSSGLLRLLAERAWLRHVGYMHRHRKHMHELVGINRELLRLDYRTLSPLQLSLQHSLQSGAFQFQAAHAKYDTSLSGMCWWCGVPDTHQHRVCECPLFDKAREGHGWICQEWPQLPACLTHHLPTRACKSTCPSLSLQPFGHP